MLSRHLFERALLGLHPAPVASPWNLEQLADLLPPEPLRPAAVLVGALVPEFRVWIAVKALFRSDRTVAPFASAMA